MLTVLFLGDVVGEPGRTAVIARLPELKEKYALDFVIVNGENAAGGRGITGKITIDLLRAGVSVVTTGDHIWDQKEIVPFLDLEPRLLRPLNYPDGAPGNGSIVLDTAKGKVGVINVQARTFMQPILENPFRAMETAVAKIRAETPNIMNSILGRTIEPIMNRFVSNLPASFPVASGEVRLRGALIEIDETTGHALRITRVDEPGAIESAATEPEPRIDIEQAPSPEQT
ncbi:MAG: metallophosphoesterase [Verrucomicrobia bacterium]|nr:MAG: metallophosphoesterase [Verrucomicrobiota bacterium]